MGEIVMIIINMVILFGWLAGIIFFLINRYRPHVEDKTPTTPVKVDVVDTPKVLEFMGPELPTYEWYIDYYKDYGKTLIKEYYEKEHKLYVSRVVITMYDGTVNEVDRIIIPRNMVAYEERPYRGKDGKVKFHHFPYDKILSSKDVFDEIHMNDDNVIVRDMCTFPTQNGGYKTIRTSEIKSMETSLIPVEST